MNGKVEPVLAAGALVWRVRTGRLQVVLVHRPRYDDWSWPKGKREPGETLVATAVREVAEETGLEVVLGIPLPRLTYPVAGRPKEVSYWAGQVGGRRESAALAARPPVPRAGRDEIDRVRWMDVDVAARRLTRASDAEPLRVLVEQHAAGLLATRTLVVARHARAVKRDRWSGDEAARPLTAVGSAQAVGLVPLLSAFGVTSVTTSAWTRCARTVAPYAAASGLTAVPSDALTEQAHALSPARAAARTVEVLVSRTDAVLCTHRPVLPTVIDVLAAHATRAAADTLPAADPFLRPAQLLVGHVADTPVGPRVVAAEVVGPPARA